MSIAAASKVEFGSAPATGQNQCSVEGCIALTASHYCATHARTCTECGAECGESEMQGEHCDDCAYTACELDQADYGARCSCGLHRATVPTLTESDRAAGVRS